MAVRDSRCHLLVIVLVTWIASWASAVLFFVAILPSLYFDDADLDRLASSLALRTRHLFGAGWDKSSVDSSNNTSYQYPYRQGEDETVQPCAFCGETCAAAAAAVGRTALWQHEWTEGTTLSMIRRTRQNIGNVGRLQRFLAKLCRGEPTNILLIGGSNTRGLQIADRSRPRFPALIEDWLNNAFPVRKSARNATRSPGSPNKKTRKHAVHNRGAGGSGACVFSASLEDSFLDVASPDPIDLILTEFAINDGLDEFVADGGKSTTTLHRPSNSPDHTPSRLCFEAIVRAALEHSPDLAVVPIELANLLTMFNGVAFHHDIAAFYGLPVLSWRDAVIPEMRSRLGPKFAPLSSARSGGGGDAEEPNLERLSTNGTDDGYGSPSLWVDGKHINLWGHRVVLDAFVHMVQTELRHPEAVQPEKLANDWRPYETTDWEDHDQEGFLRRVVFNYGRVLNNTIAGPIDKVSAERGSFYQTTAAGLGCDSSFSHFALTLFRREQYAKFRRFKTEEQARRMCDFEPVSRTDGFALYADRPQKRGWICTDSDTPQSITFEVPLPRLPHPELTYEYYSVRLGYLRSYEGMGQFTVSVAGAESGAILQALGNDTILDGTWDRPRSTGEEEEVARVTGAVNLTVKTRPDLAPKGNTLTTRAATDVDNAVGEGKGNSKANVLTAKPSREPKGNKVKILWIRAVGIGGSIV